MPLTMAMELPELAYDYAALEPYISRETMELHHDRHHRIYVEKGNALAQAAGMDHSVPLRIGQKRSFGSNDDLFNNAAQHWNHFHLWLFMKPGGGGRKIPGRLQKAIDTDLGGYDAFRASFIKAGLSRFGSGWAWLSLKDGKLDITSTPNAENPVVHGGDPLLGVDLWEHAYYVDYRQQRQKYLEAFVDHLINWDYVGQRYDKRA